MSFVVKFIKDLNVGGSGISDEDFKISSSNTSMGETDVGGEKSFFEQLESSCLKKKIAFYLPTKDRAGLDIPNTENFLERIVEYFSIRFGGCTVSEAVGYYVLGSNDQDAKKDDEPKPNEGEKESNVMGEKIHYIYSFTNDLDKTELDEVIKNFKDIKEKMNQECVSFEWENKMFFI